MAFGECYRPDVGPRRRRATYEDLLAAPPHQVAEVIAGELRLHPRRALPHAAAATALVEELGPPFKRGRGGPGGWILLMEPELHLESDILVPDLAGWHKSKLPALPAEPYLAVAPDWICEVLSPGTAKLDRADKRRCTPGRPSAMCGWSIPSRGRWRFFGSTRGSGCCWACSRIKPGCGLNPSRISNSICRRFGWTSSLPPKVDERRGLHSQSDTSAEFGNAHRTR